MVEDNNNKNNRNYYLGFGIGFGLILGALSAISIGIFVKTSLIWAFVPGIGMLIGIVIGAKMDANKNEE